MCEPAWKASMLGTGLALAQCLTLLLIPKLADRYGRRCIFKVTRFINCALYAVILISDNYYVILAALIGTGLSFAGLLNVGIPYLNEWFPRRRQTCV